MLQRFRGRIDEREPAPRPSVYSADHLSQAEDRFGVPHRRLGLDRLVRLQERGASIRQGIRRAVRNRTGSNQSWTDSILRPNKTRIRSESAPDEGKHKSFLLIS